MNTNIMSYADALRSVKTEQSVNVFSNYILRNGNEEAIQVFAEKVVNSIAEMVKEAPSLAESGLVAELLDSLAPNPGDRVESLRVTPHFGPKAQRSNKLIAHLSGGFAANQYNPGEGYKLAATAELMRKDLIQSGTSMPTEVASAAGTLSDLDERSETQPSEVASRVILVMAKNIYDNKGPPRSLSISDLIYARKLKSGRSAPVISDFSFSDPEILAPGASSSQDKTKRSAGSINNRTMPQITQSKLDILERGVSALHKNSLSGFDDSTNFRALVKEVVGPAVDTAIMQAWADALSNQLATSNKIYTKSNKLGVWLDGQGALLDFTTGASATLTADSVIDKINKELSDDGMCKKTLLLLTKFPQSEALRVLYAADSKLQARLSLMPADDREFSNDQAVTDAVGSIIEQLLSKKICGHLKA